MERQSRKWKIYNRTALHFWGIKIFPRGKSSQRKVEKCQRKVPKKAITVFFQKVFILILWTYSYENNYKSLQNIKGARW